MGKLLIEIPDVYAYTEKEMNLNIKLDDGKVKDVEYVSMNGCCGDKLEFYNLPLTNEEKTMITEDNIAKELFAEWNRIMEENKNADDK